MVKNLVFDLGGVLVDYNPRKYLTDMFLNKPLEDFLYDNIFASESWAMLDAGKITLSKATAEILENCGDKSYEAQLVLDDWHNMLATNFDMFEMLKNLKRAGYGIYYLSNISENIFTSFKSKKRFMSLFDGGIASCEVRMIKPDSAIFRLLIETYNLIPNECLFVDDNEENTAAATEQYFTSIVFKSAEELRQTLLSLGFPFSSVNIKKFMSSKSQDETKKSKKDISKNKDHKHYL